MKIVVTSSGETLESPVDPRFGRAAKFILYDTETNATEVVDNSVNVNLPQGAGIQAAGTAAGLGANIVITGHCGPKAYRALVAAGIGVVVGEEGAVSEAIERFKAGKTQPAAEPDVQGHW